MAVAAVVDVAVAAVVDVAVAAVDDDDGDDD